MNFRLLAAVHAAICFSIALVLTVAIPAESVAAGEDPTRATGPEVKTTFGSGLPRDGEDLLIPDSEYPDWPLEPEHAAYADVDGARMKDWVRRISAVSLKSRDDGNAYWGRLPGTLYDHLTMDLVTAELKRLGFSIDRQPFIIPRDWTPRSWQASLDTGSESIPLLTAFPAGETAATPEGGIKAEAVWLGIGAAPDFLGREVKGKAVVIYSTFVPGGRSHSASSRAKLFDANQRATDLGAAMIVNIMGVPGNGQFNPLGAPSAKHGVPLITVSQDEGFMLRDLLGAGEKVEITLNLDIEIRENVETANLIATLPGMSEEEIVLAAHTDGFFEGAMDNAAGLASGLEIARHYAEMPREQRPRTLVFFLFPDHHHGEVGLKTWERAHDWSKVALVLTLEHPSQTQLYWYNDDLMTANAIGAFRWHVTGSAALRKIVLGTLREHGVSTYREMNPKPKLTPQAPGFHIIDHVIYHTTLDIPELVPAEGLERSTRAFLHIIDQVNGMGLEALRAQP